MDTLKKEFKDIGDKFLVLVIPSAVKYQNTLTDILKILVNERGMRGIYITVNKSYPRLKALFMKEGIDTGRLFFVDAVSKGIYNNLEKADDCLFISDPGSLTEFSIGISNAVGKLDNENVFLFMDSLSSLLLYNSASKISKFMHALSAEIHLWDICGVIISIDKELEDDRINTFSGFCDKTIRLI